LVEARTRCIERTILPEVGRIRLATVWERPLRKEKGKVFRVVLYAEDTVQARRFAEKIEIDPRWELIALCTTPADLNYVLDRVTVDVLLLRLTPETEEGVISAVRERTRHAHMVVWVQSYVPSQFPEPNDPLLADREPQCRRRRWEGEFWAFLSSIPQSGPTCRTAKDIVGTEAYGWLDGRERPGDDSRCNILA
jgi:hypothetical protein